MPVIVRSLCDKHYLEVRRDIDMAAKAGAKKQYSAVHVLGICPCGAQGKHLVVEQTA